MHDTTIPLGLLSDVVLEQVIRRKQVVAGDRRSSVKRKRPLLSMNIIPYALAASQWICSCAFAEMSDNLSLLGITKEELVSRYGQPKDILGPATGHQTYEYPKGLAVIVHAQKVVQYVAKGASEYRTDKGIRIGSDIAEVVAQYGNYTSTEKATDWFSGNKQNVLYHHERFDRFKINYADDNLIIFLDPQRKVEVIMVGYIFPRE